MPALSRFTTIVVIAFCFVGSASAQQALLELDRDAVNRIGVEEARTVRAIAESPRSARTELVQIDLAALDAPSVAIPLLERGNLVLRTHRVDHRSDRDYTWIGQGDDPATYALLVVRDGRITGTVRSDGLLFNINPVGDGAHVFTQIDEAAINDHPADWAEIQEAAAAERGLPEAHRDHPEPARDGGQGYVITVLVPVTHASAGLSGDPGGMAQLAIDETNYTYELSGINHRVSLVHTYITDTQETGSSNDLGAMRIPNNGFMDEVHDLRQAYDADLVMLIGEYTAFCGIGYLWASSPQWGFSIVARACAAGSFVAAHEIGHNMGSHHNPESGANNTSFSYGHGTTRLNGPWRTVMAYNHNSCPGGLCPRIPYFSTPDISYQGLALGDAHTRDNVRVHNETASQISGYFGGQGGPAAVVTPGEIDLVVPGGESVTFDVQVSSTGEAPLRWWTSFGSAVPRNGAGGQHMDDFGYSWTDVRFPEGPDFNFVDISDAANAIPTDSFDTSCGDDPLLEGYAPIELPFPFPFYGEEHQTARVAVNGFVLFSDYDGCSNVVTVHPHSNLPHNLIAPLWMNMTIENGAVYSSDLADGRFVVQWSVRDVVTNRERIFQAVLFESGDIEFHYSKPNSFRTSNGQTIQNSVGIQSPGGETGLTVAFSTDAHNRIQPGYAVHVRPPIPWLSAAPGAGELFVGQNQTFTVTLDASELDEGTHTAELQVRTNDPLQPIHRIPIVANVGPVDVESGYVPLTSGITSVFPNPTAARATIAITLAEAANVDLSVYDLLGRRVATLIDDFQPAGSLEYQWNTADLASGMYIVRLAAGGDVQTTRVTVAR